MPEHAAGVSMYTPCACALITFEHEIVCATFRLKLSVTTLYFVSFTFWFAFLVRDLQMHLMQMTAHHTFIPTPNIPDMQRFCQV